MECLLSQSLVTFQPVLLRVSCLDSMIPTRTTVSLCYLSENNLTKSRKD